MREWLFRWQDECSFTLVMVLYCAAIGLLMVVVSEVAPTCGAGLYSQNGSNSMNATVIQTR